MCTVEKKGNIYILTITGNHEHRLNPTLITSIRTSLSQIKLNFTNSPSPSVLITTAHGKFFSNGYDLTWANSTSNPTKSKLQLNSLLQSLIHDLITFPMPTIAAVTGHAAAAGMILALAHDYVVMRRERGFLYMSEVDIGLVIPGWFMVLLRSRIGGSGSRGMVRVCLGGEKLTAKMGREIGVVDVVVDGVDETVAKAVEMGEEMVKRGWDGVVYREIRMVLFKDLLDLISGDGVDNGEVGVRSRL